MGPIFFFALDDIFQTKSEALDHLEASGSDEEVREICSSNEWDVFKARFSQARSEGKEIDKALEFAKDKDPQ